MSDNVGQQLVFRERPKPCAGDLRISWRIALLLLILANSRGQKASMAKLHVLNDAIRTKSSSVKLRQMLDRTRPMLEWRLRVEPALSRAVDFLVGEELAKWEASGGKMYVKLQPAGEVVVKSIEDEVDFAEINSDEVSKFSKNCSEAFINSLIGFGKQRV